MKNQFLSLFVLLLLMVLNSGCEKENPSSDIIKVKPQDTIEECYLSSVDTQVIEELNNSGVYLFNSANPEMPEDGKLDKLIDYLGVVNFVGLGESTHGTKDFYQMKDKIIRQLITKKGFKAVVFELPWGQTLKINDYVLNGIGSAITALKNTDYWVYSTYEVIDLIEWIHDYNEGLDQKDKIHFVGCDIQGANFNREISIVNDFIKKVEVDSLQSIINMYKYLPSVTNGYKNASKSNQQNNKIGTNKVYRYLDYNRDKFIGLSSEFDYNIALMASHVIQNRERVYRENKFGVERDKLMATYTQWWQKIFGNDSKVVVWAHNFHVSIVPNIAYGSFGTFMRKANGQNYKSVGFSFEKGSLNAFVAGANFEFISYARGQFIKNDICGTTNHLLSNLNGDRHYIIFDELDGESKSYFSSTHKFFQCGAGFNYQYINKYIRKFSLSRYYDVIIHFDNATKSNLLN